MSSLYRLNSTLLQRYEYCPARAKLEGVGDLSDPKSVFDVQRLLFREYFRTGMTKRQRDFRLSQMMDMYSGVLFGNQRSLKKEIQMAYNCATIEMLWHKLGGDLTYEIPGKMEVEYKDFIIDIDIDLVYWYKDKNKGHRTGIIILVNEEFWNPVDLSNRIELVLLHRHVWPEMNIEKTGLDVTYFAPLTGRVFTVKSSAFKTRAYSADYKRLDKILEGFKERHFYKRPLGTNCKQCPSFNKCSPMDYIKDGMGEANELMEPIHLDRITSNPVV